MNTIQRAILGELLPGFLLSLITLNFILMMEKLMRLSRLLSTVGASLADMARIILYIQPELLIFTSPMSLFIAVLLTYGRLGMDNELTVLGSSGMSFGSLSRPAFVLGAAAAAAGLFISFFLAPRGAFTLRETVTGIIAERAPYAIKEGAFTTAFGGIVIHVREKPSKDTLKGIFIHDGRDEKRPRTLYAESGTVTGGQGYDISLSLSEGRMHIPEGGHSTLLEFGSYELSLPLVLQTPKKRLGELSPMKLVELHRKGGWGGTEAVLELHRRLTLPLVNVAFMFLGPPLALIAGKRGRYGGLMLGFIVIGAYYAMLIYGENLVRNATVPHYAGSWAPIVVLGVVSALAYVKAASK